MKSFSFQFDLMCVHFRKLYVMVILAFPPVWMFDCPPSQESWQRQCHSDLSIKYPYKDWQPRKNILTNRAIDIQIRPIEADYFVVQICSSVQSKGWSALLPEQTVLGVAENRRQPDSQGGVTCYVTISCFYKSITAPAVGNIVRTCCPIGIHFLAGAVRPNNVNYCCFEQTTCLLSSLVYQLILIDTFPLQQIWQIRSFWMIIIKNSRNPYDMWITNWEHCCID